MTEKQLLHKLLALEESMDRQAQQLKLAQKALLGLGALRKQVRRLDQQIGRCLEQAHLLRLARKRLLQKLRNTRRAHKKIEHERRKLSKLKAQHQDIGQQLHQAARARQRSYKKGPRA